MYTSLSTTLVPHTTVFSVIQEYFMNLKWMKMTRKCHIPGCRSSYVPTILQRRKTKLKNSASQFIACFKMPMSNISGSRTFPSKIWNSVKTTWYASNIIWPANFVTVRGNGNKERPAESPSELPDVPPTCLRTLQPSQRPTLLTKMKLMCLWGETTFHFKM